MFILHCGRHTQHHFLLSPFILGEKPYLCTECGHAFIQRSHLMEHIKTHSEERPYKCHMCDRGFKQSSSLKSHIKIHTGQKPFQCSQCPYSCRQSYSLTQHMRQHKADLPRSDRPHECVICHRTFTTVAMLTSHARAIHNAML